MDESASGGRRIFERNKAKAWNRDQKQSVQITPIACTSTYLTGLRRNKIWIIVRRCLAFPCVFRRLHSSTTNAKQRECVWEGQNPQRDMSNPKIETLSIFVESAWEFPSMIPIRDGSALSSTMKTKLVKLSWAAPASSFCRWCLSHFP